MIYKISTDNGENWEQVSQAQFVDSLMQSFSSHWQISFRLADVYQRIVSKNGQSWKIEKPAEISETQFRQNVGLMRGEKEQGID